MLAQNWVKSGALFKGKVTPAKLKDEPPYTAIRPKDLARSRVAKNHRTTHKGISAIKEKLSE